MFRLPAAARRFSTASNRGVVYVKPGVVEVSARSRRAGWGSRAWLAS